MLQAFLAEPAAVLGIFLWNVSTDHIVPGQTCITCNTGSFVQWVLAVVAFPLVCSLLDIQDVGYRKPPIFCEVAFDDVQVDSHVEGSLLDTAAKDLHHSFICRDKQARLTHARTHETL